MNQLANLSLIIMYDNAVKTKHMPYNQTVTLPPTSEECTVGLVKQFDQCI